MIALKRFFVAAAFALFAQTAFAQVDQGGGGEGGGGGSNFSGSGALSLPSNVGIVVSLYASVCTSAQINNGDAVSVSVIWHDPATGWQTGGFAWYHQGTTQPNYCSSASGVFWPFPSGATIYGSATITYANGSTSPSFQLSPATVN